MTPERIVALILCLAVLVASLRLLLWHRAAGAQASLLRLALLLLLQPLAAALLHTALFPPTTTAGTSSLRVATAGTSRLAAAAGGAPLILLPQAPAIGGGEAVPDLATALRRHPGVTSLTVLGNGLGPRDIDAARGLTVQYDPPPLSTGILHLAPPPTVAPGARFTVGAILTGLPTATVELIDPAGRVTDSAAPDRDGHVLLAGTARAAGAITFTLRVRQDRHIVEQADVPVRVEDSARPRLLILAGAPGAEVKYLRRWAIDAGYDVTTQMSAGGGVALGDAPVAITPASLRRFDAAIVDDRSWTGARGALLAAVRGGMGLVLRAGGPIDGATRSQWQALGFGLTGPAGVAPLALPKADAEPVARTRYGIGSTEAPIDIATPEDYLPEISRLAMTPGGSGAVPLLRDAGGATLAAWRALGRGRIALFTGIDSYALTLTGRRDLHGDWWSAMLDSVARPAAGIRVITNSGWTGERMTLCGLSSEGRVDGRVRILPVAGCGGYWPDRAGWHELNGKDGVRAFYIQPANALPVMRAARDRQAMALLPATAASRAATMLPDRTGAAWPWWLAWLAVSAFLWWLERSRTGRRAAADQSAR
ncbi:carboxypeptidase regulatory-like domain-containing protein [Sphingobium sp. HBC34]|uniref:Carboxypeptidase regulatory-like domain-containing protein n=1 Tax=Sphingobium cyanobacteriorum TaxID=3063954 RepID=A0ABT8ZLE3_9SPHN|nr:carboxypeptidase regulatory-like domain-containing protein [Sphingobium sp. HBC34]MDO7835367.1 carboxypeptidase regulatory-like domain-containing protein [Sphingobium sp. HBC34]